MSFSDEDLLQRFDNCLDVAAGSLHRLELRLTSDTVRENTTAKTKEVIYVRDASGVNFKISLSLIKGADLAVLHGFLVRADKNISISDYLRTAYSPAHEQALRLSTNSPTFADNLCTQVSGLFSVLGTSLLPVLQGEAWVNVPVDFQGLK